MSVVSGYQLCGMCRKASGYRGAPSPDSDPVNFLSTLWGDGRLNLPFDPEGVFWIPTRIPIFSDMQKSMEKSLLLSQLSMRSADTGLVVDALRQGGDAVFFARLISQDETAEASNWLERMNPRTANITIQTVDDEFLLILATFKTFVVSYVSD